MARVVVLGGGMAGMTAAHELAERGFEVVVLERRDAAGGKARSIEVPPGGLGERAPGTISEAPPGGLPPGRDARSSMRSSIRPGLASRSIRSRCSRFLPGFRAHRPTR
jgi:choline dehydrogenase-like flavoprotein